MTLDDEILLFVVEWMLSECVISVTSQNKNKKFPLREMEDLTKRQQGFIATKKMAQESYSMQHRIME